MNNNLKLDRLLSLVDVNRDVIKIDSGYFDKKGYYSTIDAFAFKSLVIKLKKDNRTTLKNDFLIYEDYGNGYIKIINNKSDTTYIHRTIVGHSDFPQQNIRINLERDAVYSGNQNWGEDCTTLNSRVYTFTHENNYILELKHDEGATGHDFFHYTLILPANSAINTVESMMGYFDRTLNDSKRNREMIYYFNKLLRKNSNFPETVGKKPRDLTVNTILKLKDHMMHIKVDGDGYSLFIFKDKGYLVNPTNVILFLNKVPSDLNNTILQGEYDEKKFFSIYDIYYLSGKK